MKIASAILTVFLITATWFLWLLHPWTPAGDAIALGKWQFDDFEVQAWQKNPDTLEPFADALFVRRGTNSWEVFRFDIQDGYLPTVRLERCGGEINVYRSGERRGVYDLVTHTFRRRGETFTPMGVNGAPPGDWGLSSWK